MGLTIYLDLDGPLVDPSARYHSVYSDCIREQGGFPLTFDAYWALKREARREEDIVMAFHPRLDARRHGRLFLDEIETPLRLEEDVVVEGALETLSRLHGDNRLVLATLRRKGGPLRRQLSVLGLDRMLDGVLQEEGNDGSWRRKAGMILKDRGRAGTGAAGVGMLVGDTESDLLAARAAGIPGIAVCNGIRSAALLSAFAPHRLLASICDLPGVIDPGASSWGGNGDRRRPRTAREGM